MNEDLYKKIKDFIKLIPEESRPTVEEFVDFIQSKMSFDTLEVKEIA